MNGYILHLFILWILIYGLQTQESIIRDPRVTSFYDKYKIYFLFWLEFHYENVIIKFVYNI